MKKIVVIVMALVSISIPVSGGARARVPAQYLEVKRCADLANFIVFAGFSGSLGQEASAAQENLSKKLADMEIQYHLPSPTSGQIADDAVRLKSRYLRGGHPVRDSNGRQLFDLDREVCESSGMFSAQ